jgi:hypothetical protein
MGQKTDGRAGTYEVHPIGYVHSRTSPDRMALGAREVWAGRAAHHSI